jgi:phosphoribosylaminoimidazole carboxylase (NCAIR synthetase)
MSGEIRTDNVLIIHAGARYVRAIHAEIEAKNELEKAKARREEVANELEYLGVLSVETAQVFKDAGGAV